MGKRGRSSSSTAADSVTRRDRHAPPITVGTDFSGLDTPLYAFMRLSLNTHHIFSSDSNTDTKAIKINDWGRRFNCSSPRRRICIRPVTQYRLDQFSIPT
jgi:hypothetical protein